MLARGMNQAEVARRMGAHTSNLSRIMQGKLTLTPVNRRALTEILNCPEAAFLDPVGAPVPMPTVDDAKTVEKPPDLDRRLQVVVTAFGADRVEALLRFLATGDYAGLPPDVVRRFRDILAEMD
jgi:transcriptional regulator with XRE-family HTH domain